MCCVIGALSIMLFARAWVLIRHRVLRRPEPSLFAPPARRPAPRPVAGPVLTASGS